MKLLSGAKTKHPSQAKLMTIALTSYCLGLFVGGRACMELSVPDEEAVLMAGSRVLWSWRAEESGWWRRWKNWRNGWDWNVEKANRERFKASDEASEFDGGWDSSHTASSSTEFLPNLSDLIFLSLSLFFMVQSYFHIKNLREFHFSI